MNKQEFVADVAERAQLTKADAEKAIEAVFASITEALSTGGEVRLIGFGTFTTLERAESEGRNPKTGEKIKIPATVVPKFKAGKQLKEAVAK